MSGTSTSFPFGSRCPNCPKKLDTISRWSPLAVKMGVQLAIMASSSPWTSVLSSPRSFSRHWIGA
eukprot:244524-Alexandrium_andersonii.AAC.1